MGQIILGTTSGNQESAQAEETHTKRGLNQKQCAPSVSHQVEHKKWIPDADSTVYLLIKHTISYACTLPTEQLAVKPQSQSNSGQYKW